MVDAVTFGERSDRDDDDLTASWFLGGLIGI
jgi:hypothetical protein